MAYGPATRTVAELKRNVQRTFGDESGVQLEDADIFMWINDAADEINRRNKLLKASSTTPSVIGQQAYTFPSDRILQVESIHYAGSRLPNMSFAQAEEEIINGGTVSQNSGEPYLWYEYGGTFNFWPVPQTVQDITVYYTQMPVHVTTLTDVLPLSDKYFQDIVLFVLKRAYEMDEDWQASQIKGQEFDASVDGAAEEERTAQHTTYSTITVYDFFD